MQRVVEVGMCAILLVFLLPVILIAVLAITVSSPGAAILAQERIGRFGIPFRCYKLRTMYVDAPLGPSHTVSKRHYTFIGRILRKTSIDELPQLWNVLNGTMRVVGPRPSLTTQLELIAERKRLGILDVHPGITGLAQSRDIDMSKLDELVAVDRTYVENRSIALDLQIIFQTVTMMIGKVLRR